MNPPRELGLPSYVGGDHHGNAARSRGAATGYTLYAKASELEVPLAGGGGMGRLPPLSGVAGVRSGGGGGASGGRSWLHLLLHSLSLMLILHLTYQLQAGGSLCACVLRKCCGRGASTRTTARALRPAAKRPACRVLPRERTNKACELSIHCPLPGACNTQPPYTQSSRRQRFLSGRVASEVGAKRRRRWHRRQRQRQRQRQRRRCLV